MIITPNYHFQGDCEDALKLYEKAFSGKIIELMRYSDADPSDISVEHMTNRERNFVYHAEMMIENNRFFFSDSMDEISKGQNISVVITFDSSQEVKNAYNVLSEGGSIIHQMTETTYSSCFVSLVDRFGMRWELMTENNS